jgi:phage N-6-adenine-methyltransferase
MAVNFARLPEKGSNLILVCLWETPADLGAALSLAVGGFDLDPCAPSRDVRRARVKARLLLTVEDDGLAVPWRGQVFVNPPYGRVLPRWVHKCAAESASARAVVVALLPARPDTRWWHEHVAGTADVFMLRGRLRFGDGEQAAPFPSAVVTWGAKQELLARLAFTLPDAWHVPRRHNAILLACDYNPQHKAAFPASIICQRAPAARRR